MNAWRVLLSLSFLLLGGCLVSFETPLPTTRQAPQALLGQWRSKDAWGDSLTLVISPGAQGGYEAVARSPGQQPRSHAFTVLRHGSRWYASGRAPQHLGGNFLIAGFEILEDGDLVVYDLDAEQVRQALQAGELSGRSRVQPGEQGQGVLVDSPPERVLAYLDDPANSDLFIEVARFQRVHR